MTTDPIHAPWTSDQVTALNAFQHYGRMHPFTCGALHASGQSPILVATASGWVCPDPQCTFRQDWAHAFMIERGAAAVPVPPPADQTALRASVAEALLDHLSRTADIRPGRDGALAFMPEVTDAERLRIADAVLAVLPEPTDQLVECSECDDTGACNGGPCLLRRVAAEEQPAETQARPPLHEWFVETRMLDGRWSKYGASRDTAEDGRELFERDTTGPGNGHAFRLVRATTTYVVEADHQPDTETQPAP